MAENDNHNRMTFGGGCFWGMEKHFREEFGSAIRSVQVGYAGGTLANPTYENVCQGDTGHAEAITAIYDPEKVSYRKLLDFFWSIHDPTTKNAQGMDRGTQYRSVVFYHTPEQKTEAENYKKELQASKFNKPIVTEIVEATTFYPAEEYHQNYLKKNPHGYCNHFRRWTQN
ncbi:peptide methionine sulfoxide reductase-like [Schistocerca gregaria]|uniref:peptide methionine sulfoxide reductase-like n=1 Tax=Schistocerca gregaria TaxID=7010 RepID=UPI00211F2F23|nr:peptide methionine sulfoxide reductase-like [Schistocerca gregaria]